MKSPPAADIPVEKKGHLCPPSDATHPRDRWESFFVYAFICKFTQLRGKVDGFETAMDFEDSLLSPDADPIMTQILARFILNLRPQTRNLNSEVISNTVAGILQEFLKTNERTVFWDEDRKVNVDPFHELEGGFWGAEWGLRLKILRQLVELQLSHSTEIKGLIDRAWGVVHNKHKKNEATPNQPPPSDPHSQENLQLLPLGQDIQRKRYWVVDDSPRVYLSTNPWKITATFRCMSSSREDYVALVESLKQNAPQDTKPGERRPKVEQGHLNLIQVLEDRLPAIDAELARIQRARKKMAQRAILIAQAEVRETRTRRRVTRPDYAYLNDPEEDVDQDEYKFQDDEDEEFDYDEDDFGGGASHRRLRDGPRRSTRTTRSTSNGQRTLDDWSQWRGERRSSRLGAPSETQLDAPPPKRARTVESTASSVEADGHTSSSNGRSGSVKLKVGGAAAIKPTETVVETIAGKKKSRFWVYAVEPIAPTQDVAPPPPSSDYDMSESSIGPSTGDGQLEDSVIDIERESSTEYGTSGDSYRKSANGSFSPSPDSMDES